MLKNLHIIIVTACYIYTAAAASALNYRGSMSLISKSQAGNVYIKPTAFLKAPFFSL
jgi:hypothetical protein